MKKTVKKNIAEMKNLVKNMPKTINEIISFEGDDAALDGYDDEEMPEEGPLDEPEAEEGDKRAKSALDLGAGPDYRK